MDYGAGGWDGGIWTYGAEGNLPLLRLPRPRFKSYDLDLSWRRFSLPAPALSPSPSPFPVGISYSLYVGGLTFVRRILRKSRRDKKNEREGYFPAPHLQQDYYLKSRVKHKAHTILRRLVASCAVKPLAAVCREGDPNLGGLLCYLTAFRAHFLATHTRREREAYFPPAYDVVGRKTSLQRIAFSSLGAKTRRCFW